MGQQDSTTHFDFTNLLATGAFLRDAQQVHVMLGPWSTTPGSATIEAALSCPDFYDAEKPSFLNPLKSFTFPVSTFARALLQWIELQPGPVISAPVWREPAKEDFERSFSRILNLISEGQIDKAVPVVFARSDFKVTAGSRARWILELLRAPEPLFPYGWWDGDEGFLGATPELLYRVEDRNLSTMALAGTLAKLQGNAQDLMRSTKDQFEHRLVVEDLQRQLGRWGRVQCGSTNVLELPQLLHLKTDLSVRLDGPPEVLQLVQELHPTPALGVSPRLFGWRWMRELPGQQNRRWFGAPVTFRFNSETAISLVGIRNLQWDATGLMLGSGCGVVASSEMEKEWDELSNKRRSVLALFGMKS